MGSMFRHFRFRPSMAAAAALSAGLFAALSLTGCGDESRAERSPPGAQPGNVVELSSAQLKSIRIAQVRTHVFRTEKEAVGSVGFAEDPSIVQSESTLVAAAANYALTKKELVRVRALGQTNGIAQKEVEQAVSDEETAAAALKAARDGVRALGKTDAEVDRMIAAGSIDAAGLPGHASKWVVANAAEDDSPLFRVGQAVNVRIDAYPGRVFSGRVSVIYATVDPTTRRVMVRCAVDDPDNLLRTGMFADMAIETAEPETSVSLPDNGIVREGDGTLTAWVTSDRRRFVQRTVRAGMREDGQVQILQGLRPGELAVTDGAIFLDNMLQAVPDD
jgi:cobalt-zinc-cadmium efflux system membrane fusion protein